MSPTSPQPAAEPFRVTRRRQRVPLSCAPCRSKKLRCNRASPCSNCERRGDISSCTYVDSRDRRRLTSVSASNLSPSEVQNRIDRLEDLVLLLMNNGEGSTSRSSARRTADSMGSNENTSSSSANAGTPPSLSNGSDMVDNDSDTEVVTKSFGAMKVESDNTHRYISESHWASVLTDLNDVRTYLDGRAIQQKLETEMASAKTSCQDDQSSFDPDPILGGCKLMTEAEVRDRFPPRHIADQLIELALSPSDYVTSIIHTPTYKKQYEDHWKDPSKSSLSWIALSFGLMRRGAHSRTMLGCAPAELDPRLKEEVRQLRFYIIQCLMLLDYTKPHRYIIEIFLLFLWGSSEMNDDYNWIVTTLLTRLAMRMGYHRDPKGFPNISAFEGEMRRRVWSLVRQADIWFSYLSGMPSIVSDELTDTENPRNLFDEDIHEDISELPPSQPASVETTSTFLNVKGNIVRALNQVLHHVQLANGSSYDEVMRIDQDLRAARDSAPTFFWPGDFTGDRPVFNVYLGWAIFGIYHKAQCVLHRRFLRAGTENSRYDYSRRQVVDSSQRLLQLQSLLHKEAKPEGHLTGLISHLTLPLLGDFIMAAFLLTMHMLQLRLKKTRTPLVEPHVMQEEHDILSALRRSYEIWGEHRNHSKHTLKAHILLGCIVERLQVKPTSNNAKFSDASNQPSVMRTTAMTNSSSNDANTYGVVAPVTGTSANQGLRNHFSQSVFNDDPMNIPTSCIDSSPTTMANQAPSSFSMQTPHSGSQVPSYPTPTSTTGLQGPGDPDINPLHGLSVPFTPSAWMDSLANIPENDIDWNTNLWDSYVKDSDLLDSSIPFIASESTGFISPEDMQTTLPPMPNQRDLNEQ